MIISLLLLPATLLHFSQQNTFAPFYLGCRGESDIKYLNVLEPVSGLWKVQLESTPDGLIPAVKEMGSLTGNY